MTSNDSEFSHDADAASVDVSPIRRLMPPPDDGADLSANEIIDRVPLKRVRHYCAPLGRWITVQEAPAAAKDKIMATQVTVEDGIVKTNTAGIIIGWAMVGWVDTKGRRLFVGDVGKKRIGELPWAVVDDVADAVRAIGGDEPAAEPDPETGAVPESGMVGNSEIDRTAST